MTVKEMIEELKKMPADREVYVVVGNNQVKRADFYFEEKEIASGSFYRDVVIMYGEY